jgi:hypothetical protein
MFTVTFINPANFRREALYPRSLKFGSTHTQFFQREIIAKAFEVHKGIEEKVKSWMQTAKVPIDRILSDKHTILKFLETGILISTKKPILAIPKTAGFTLNKSDISWNYRQIWYLAYLKFLLETLLPILMRYNACRILLGVYTYAR